MEVCFKKNICNFVSLFDETRTKKTQTIKIMKKSIIVILALILSLAAYSQKETSAVVLYFKADLACCKARACAAVENDVKTIVENNFKEGNVVFKSSTPTFAACLASSFSKE